MVVISTMLAPRHTVVAGNQGIRNPGPKRQARKTCHCPISTFPCFSDLGLKPLLLLIAQGRWLGSSQDQPRPWALILVQLLWFNASSLSTADLYLIDASSQKLWVVGRGEPALERQSTRDNTDRFCWLKRPQGRARFSSCDSS